MSLDLAKFMNLVMLDEGVDRARMVVQMGIKRWGNSRIAKAMNEAEKKLVARQELFVQRKGIKKYYFTWRYAIDHDIPAQIGPPPKPRKPKGQSFTPRPNFVDRYWKAPRRMVEG